MAGCAGISDMTQGIGASLLFPLFRGLLADVSPPLRPAGWVVDHRDLLHDLLEPGRRTGFDVAKRAMPEQFIHRNSQDFSIFPTRGGREITRLSSLTPRLSFGRWPSFVPARTLFSNPA